MGSVGATCNVAGFRNTKRKPKCDYVDIELEVKSFGLTIVHDDIRWPKLGFHEGKSTLDALGFGSVDLHGEEAIRFDILNVGISRTKRDGVSLLLELGRYGFADIAACPDDEYYKSRHECEARIGITV